MKEFGHVDVLVNAAGTMNQEAMIGEVDCDIWWSDFVSTSYQLHGMLTLTTTINVGVKRPWCLQHHSCIYQSHRRERHRDQSCQFGCLPPRARSILVHKLAAIKLAEYLDLGTYIEFQFLSGSFLFSALRSKKSNLVWIYKDINEWIL